MPTIKRSILLALILTVCAAAQVIAQPQVKIIPDVIYGHKDGLAMTFDAEQAPQTKNDYSKAETWLCRPGREDACSVDLTTTIVAANGKLTEEKWKANPNAPIDCFYVYPTVSNDPTPNSDMNTGPEERSVVQHQFARFGSQCRPYTPLYRQVTLRQSVGEADGG